MQLQMTAPLDIGLEQTDASLGGQDDFFDLERTEREARKKDQFAAWADGQEDVGSDDEEAAEEAADSDVEGAEDRRLKGLELELDGLYDAYQTRLRERDAKFKVKESRGENTERADWGGIKGSDDEDSAEESEDGGWDEMQERRLEDSDSSDDDSDEDAAVSGKKRRGAALIQGSSKRSRLVTKLKAPPPSASQASKVWFSQDIFEGMDDGDWENEDDEDENDDSDNDNDVDMEVRFQSAALNYFKQHFCRMSKAQRSLKTNMKSSHKILMTMSQDGMLMTKTKMQRNKLESKVCGGFL